MSQPLILDNNSQEIESEELSQSVFKILQAPPVQLMEDLNKIGRTTKFDYKKEDLLYSQNPIVILKTFITSYRLLLNIDNNYKEASEKKGIHDRFIVPFKKLYIEATGLIYDYQIDMDYGKEDVYDKILYLIVNNLIQINEINDYIYSLGKTDKLYDVEKNIGFY